jgi:hypothetical protein
MVGGLAARFASVSALVDMPSPLPSCHCQDLEFCRQMISRDRNSSEDFRRKDTSGMKGVLQPAVAGPSCCKSSILRSLGYGTFPDELAEASMSSCHCSRLYPSAQGSSLRQFGRQACDFRGLEDRSTPLQLYHAWIAGLTGCKHAGEARC